MSSKSEWLMKLLKVMSQPKISTILCTQCNAFIECPTPPPKPHTIRSEYAPSQQEIAPTRALIEEEKLVLKKYDAEIKRIRGALDQLEADRKQIKERIRARKGTLSMLRRLPVEVLERIFTFACTEASTAYMRPASVDGYSLLISAYHEMPLRAPAYFISRTSSHWRQIVTRMPHAWSSIHLDIRCGLPYSVTRIIKLYLRNARSAPLKIGIAESDKSERDSREERGFGPGLPYSRAYLDEYSVGAYRLLFSCMARCMELDLDVNWEVLHKDLIGQPHLAFPALRRFRDRIDVTGQAQSGPDANWFWDALNGTQELEFVDTFREPHPLIPLHQLTSLQIAKLHGIEHVFPILKNTTKLESLRILEFEGLREGKTNHQPPDEPLALRHLSIRSSDDLWYFDHLFRSLEPVMSLRTLEWIGIDSHQQIYEEQFEIPSWFIYFLQASSNILQELTLNFGQLHFTDSSMSEVLQSCPNLTYFNVSLSGDNVVGSKAAPCIAHMLSKLYVSASSSTILVPKLTRLFIHENNSNLNFLVAEVLLRMASLRSRSGLARSGRMADVVPLARVHLSYSPIGWRTGEGEESWSYEVSPFRDASIQQRMDELKEDGTICTLEERKPKW
ncbi:hypothetical protein VNI00_007008 [Paramarasmius palmivorus]|uniref:F-box domain-containing protein n=1 Tax=Paramarasmius palmivorus TaxID=297713 RepID=A0AAW0D408_9AGAR